MHNLMKMLAIALSNLLLSGVSFAADTDHFREYSKMMTESDMVISQIQDQHKSLCQQILQDCKKNEKTYRLPVEVPLFTRKGYKFTSAGTLSENTQFAILGSVKNYYKVKIEKKKYFLIKTDVDSNHSSGCEAQYGHCLAGTK
jgi:hypothetical protein